MNRTVTNFDRWYGVAAEVVSTTDRTNSWSAQIKRCNSGTLKHAQEIEHTSRKSDDGFSILGFRVKGGTPENSGKHSCQWTEECKKRTGPRTGQYGWPDFGYGGEGIVKLVKKMTKVGKMKTQLSGWSNDNAIKALLQMLVWARSKKKFWALSDRGLRTCHCVSYCVRRLKNFVVVATLWSHEHAIKYENLNP